MPLTDNLVAWYRNNATDYSGSGNDLTPIGTPQTGTGIDGTAGTAMVVSTAFGYFSRAAMVTNGAFSFSAFVKLAVAPASGLMVPMSEFASFPAIRPHIEIDLNGATDVTAGFDSAAPFYAVGPPVTNTNWHHYAATFTPDTVKLYIDGALVDTETGVADMNVSGFSIGISAVNDVMSLQYVAVWSRVLTPDEVATLFNTGEGLDPTVQANGLTGLSAVSRQPSLTAVPE